MSERHVLITRPESDCDAIKEILISKNYQVTCQSFLKVVLHDVVISNLEEYGGLIFTSQNGVRAFVKNFDRCDIDVPVYVVGKNTADEAHQCGFKTIHNADGTVEDVAGLITSHPAQKPYLYVRGRDISKDLVSLCEGVQIDQLVAYHTDKIEEISDVEGISEVIFFSKRTAEAFVVAIQGTHTQNSLKRTKALCLGDSMVESLSVLPWQGIVVAAKPNRDGILALLD